MKKLLKRPESCILCVGPQCQREYTMLHAAAEKGWLDLDAVAHESVLSIKRAGVDLILTYFAEAIADSLSKK